RGRAPAGKPAAEPELSPWLRYCSNIEKMSDAELEEMLAYCDEERDRERELKAKANKPPGDDGPGASGTPVPRPGGPKPSDGSGACGPAASSPLSASERGGGEEGVAPAGPRPLPPAPPPRSGEGGSKLKTDPAPPRPSPRDHSGEREHVRLHGREQADDARQQDRVPDHGLEDVRLLADLMGPGGRDADALGVDHFPHHPAGAVRGADECLGLALGEVGHRPGTGGGVHLGLG